MVVVLVVSLNPLKRVNSILTVSIENMMRTVVFGLNPLKRVNSILTLPELTELRKTQVKVSIPSNGSIQFLQ